MSLPIVLACALALVHLYCGRLQLHTSLSRRMWLSFAGGVAVAYVFVHLLPELHEGQGVLERSGVEEVVGFVESHVYLVALIGLVLFYGLERLAHTSKSLRASDSSGDEQAGRASVLFTIHAASFALYNALIGYLLVHREDQTISGLILFAVAMMFHFIVNDYGLRNHFRDLYHRTGRWVLAGSIIIGMMIGLVTKIDEAALAVLVAFLGGGVILNVLKEELPEEKQGRFLPFLGGVLFYSIILLSH